MEPFEQQLANVNFSLDYIVTLGEQAYLVRDLLCRQSAHNSLPHPAAMIDDLLEIYAVRVAEINSPFFLAIPTTPRQDIDGMNRICLDGTTPKCHSSIQMQVMENRHHVEVCLRAKSGHIEGGLREIC